MSGLDTIKSAVLGNPPDPNKKPDPVGVVRAFAEQQAQVEAAQAGALVVGTFAQLPTGAVPSANIMAWVMTGAQAGIYGNTGSALTPVWTKRGDIPQFFVLGMNVGAGTPDAIQVTTDLPVPTQDGRALIGIQVIAANTVSPPTVSINGSAALPVVTSSGNNVVVGGLKPGIYAGFKSGVKFQLLSDQATQALVNAAEAAADRAEAAAAEAAALASGLAPVFASKMLAAAYSPVTAPDFLQLVGFAAAGDGGQAVYRKVVSEPSHQGKLSITTQGGSTVWYEISVNGPLNAACFGSGQAAIEAAHAVVDEIIIDRNYIISTTATWPNGKKYQFINNGRLTISNSVTLTIRGVIFAGNKRAIPSTEYQKIFYRTGTGSVVGLRYVNAAWFGVDTSSSDNSADFNACSLCVDASFLSDGGRPTIEIPSGSFKINSTWFIRPTADISLEVKGQGNIFSGSRLTSGSGMTAGSIMVQIDGNTDSTQCISDYYIHDFGIIKDLGSPDYGLIHGSNNPLKKIIGLHASKIENIFISNFPQSFTISHVRQCEYRRIAVWNDGMGTSVNSNVMITQSGGFTGDLNFYDCQLVGTNNANNILVHVLSNNAPSTAGDNNFIAGVRFHGDCVFYSGGTRVRIYAGLGSKAHDIFLLAGLQMDGSSTCDVWLIANTAASTVKHISLEGVWIAGSNRGSGNIQIRMDSAALGAIDTVKITDSFFNGCQGRFLNADNVLNLHVCGNQIKDITNAAGPAVQISGTQIVAVNDNTVHNPAGQKVLYFAQIQGACDDYVFTNNRSRQARTGVALNDAGSGTNKIVSPNL